MSVFFVSLIGLSRAFACHFFSFSPLFICTEEKANLRS